MQITHNQAVLLYTELGFRNASKYTVERLNTKLAEITDHFTDDEPMETPEGRKLLKQVMAAREKNEDVTIAEEGEAAPEKPASKKKVKPTAESKPAEEEDDDEDEAEAQAAKQAAEGSAEEAQAKKGKKGKKSRDPGKLAEKLVAASAKGKKSPPEKPAAEKPAPKKKASKSKDPGDGDDRLPKDEFGNRLGTDLAKINKCLSAKGKDLSKLTAESGVRRGRVRRHLKKLLAKKLVKADKEGNWTKA